MVALLTLFLGLAAGSHALFDQTENRLLQQHTNEAGSALQISVSQVKAPLDAASKLALATNGDPAAFQKIMQPNIGAGKTYSSAALFRLGSTEPIVVVGIQLSVAIDGDDATASMLANATTNPFVVVDLLGGETRRLGYAVADSAQGSQYVAYGERTLSGDPNVRQRHDQPFAQLDYAIYLGDQPSADHLLGASVSQIPLTGRTASQKIAFGNTDLLIQMRPIGHLGGTLFANLWWIVAATGLMVAVAIALLSKSLLDRRDTALHLAVENERLFDEQRHIAETLQLGLLPQHLATPAGVIVAARYWPAGSANLIGGDFYDMFDVGDGRWGLAIGDVCGKGIEAAALTGLARHTLRAAARSAQSPTEVLLAVHHALRDHQPSTFCTACFAYVHPAEADRYRIEMALGGHPQPLIRRRDGTVESVGQLGMLLGMIEPTMSTTKLELMPGDTMVFYTDGLTDAPAPQAVSVSELVTLLEIEGDQPIERLADSIRALKRARRPAGSGDDTALMILRFDPLAASSKYAGPAVSEDSADSEAEVPSPSV